MIVAFARESNSSKIRDILESAGAASCLICRNAAEVKRVIHKRKIRIVICGFRLPDETCQEMYQDLPDFCSMLMIASQSSLDLCEDDDIVKLAAPVGRDELLSTVGRMVQFSLDELRKSHAPRSEEEQLLIDQAKEMLMRSQGMTEEQAHRFLQKKSMDNGIKLAETARMILSGQINNGESEKAAVQ